MTPWGKTLVEKVAAEIAQGVYADDSPSAEIALDVVRTVLESMKEPSPEMLWACYPDVTYETQNRIEAVCTQALKEVEP